MEKISKSSAQQIVETVKDVCGQDINFIDNEGKIYASTKAERIGSFHEIGKQVLLSQKTIEVEEDDQFPGTQAGVNIPIRYHDTVLSVIGISGKPEEVRKYAYLAQKITLRVLREQELIERSKITEDRIHFVMQSLLQKEEAKNQKVKNFIEEYNLDDKQPYRLLLIRVNPRYNPNNLALLESSIFSLFQKSGSPLYSFRYPEEYLLILRSSEWEANQENFLHLAEEQRGLLRLSLSAPHPLLKQYLSYQESKLAQESSKQDSILFYEKLGLELLCASVDSAHGKLFKDKFLKQLKESDLELLRCYYQEEMSLVNTAKKLFLHKNTVQYQLDRIYEKTGYNPRLFSDAVSFYAALLL